MTTTTTISRDTLAEFLSPHTPSGQAFPTGDAMRAAGAAHGNADAIGNGYDYRLHEVTHAIAEWVTYADARAYMLSHAAAYRIATTTTQH